MTEFGFSIQQDLMLDHDLLSPAYDALLEKVPGVALCLSCGTCTGSCISSETTGYGFRNLVVMLKNRQHILLEEALKNCQFCGKCFMVCPRGINTRKAILEMKNYFNRRGNDNN
jgi:heterodisulfide reductase subunit C